MKECFVEERIDKTLFKASFGFTRIKRSFNYFKLETDYVGLFMAL